MNPRTINAKNFLILLILFFFSCTITFASVHPYDFETNGIFYTINPDGLTVDVSYKNESFNTYLGDITIPEEVICPYKRLPQFSSQEYSGWVYSNPAVELNQQTIIDDKVYLYKTSNGLDLTLTSPAFSCSRGQTIDMTVIWVTEQWQNFNFVISDVALTAALLNENGETVDSVTYKPTSLSRINSVNLSIDVPFELSNARLRFAAWNADINSYGSIRSIEISPKIDNKSYTVIGIGDYAFKECRDLYNVTIPNSIITIGKQAFYNCNALTNIIIPNSVTTIGNESFNNCENLNSITLGNSITTICENAFLGTIGLESLYWNTINCNTNGNMTTSNISHIIIGSEVEVLPDNFVANSKITEVTLPCSIVSIGNNAFNGCTRLTTLTIPHSLTTIGFNAFYDCMGLTNLIWNAINCNTTGNMFTSNIENVTIGNEVSILPDRFLSDSKITEIHIPNSVTTIGSSAFKNCSYLTMVSIPNSIHVINSEAFKGCSNLNSVIMLCPTPPLGSYNMFPINQVIYVPNVSNYRNSSYWSSYNIQGFYSILPQITKATVSSNKNDVILLQKALLKDSNGQTIMVFNSQDNVINLTDLMPHTNNNVGISVIIGQDTINNDDSFATNPITLSDFRSLSRNITTLLTTFSVSRDEGIVLDSCGVEIVEGTKYIGYINETSEGSYTVECRITGLNPNNNYNLRPWVVYKGVTFYGTIVTIQTESVSFTQFALSSKTQTTLTPSFCVNRDDGFILEACGVESSSESYAGTITETSDDNYTIKCIISGLVPNKSYEFRPWVQADGKKYYGDYKTFNTNPIDVNNEVVVTPTSVNINSTYSSGDASVTDAYFTFNGESMKTLYQTGLNPSTTYSYTYTVETTSGNQVNNYSFYTPVLTMLAQPVKMLTNTTVLFEAETNMIDEETMVGFEWRRYDAPNEMPSTQVYSPVFDGKIAGTLKNLSENVYYKYRPFYTSNSGKSYYGNWVAFLTADADVEYEPMVYTYNSPVVTQTDATLEGVALQGSDEITEQGFEYWKSSNSTLTKVTALGERMSKKVSGLQSGAKYIFRAFLTAGGETHYGNEVEFVTLSNSLDVNLDGEINIADINMIIDIILTGKPGVTGDTNGDGEVNIADINTVIDAILSH